jgi:hypothetical protein
MTTQQNPDTPPASPEIAATPSTPETPASEPAAPEQTVPQPTAPPPVASKPAAPKPAKKKSSGGKIFLVVALFLIVILAAAAGGGWYYLKHHVVVIAHHTLTLMTPDQIAAAQSPDQNADQTASQSPDQTSAQTDTQPQTTAPAPDQSQQSPAATAPLTSPAVTSKKPAAGNKKSPAQPASATSAMANNQPAPAISTVDRPVAQPRIPSVSFDPFKLDPETNSRLKIDPSKFPAGLTFTVFMDGQTLYTGNTSNRADFDKFVIPPGVHQMQLTVSSGNVSLTSNIVSTEFVVKKHLTFKVEFRVANTPPQSNAPALDPNTQLIAKLKTDLFHF